ncbi:adenylate/guanylate cyclase domain-containing protein [Shimia thalassica]|uniref:adenylate/guanylate cyclase domain-containing protein n=1 Tax=Shimia thalassica TaxID=1715693 RepID=UPI000C083130|nr:adenylate/guanylate cyclase domain-containing protein [Shimia thalassica]MDO6478748.1 adenylate/guanylate cyclase domain-containing protein [Shimia thalassica]PHO04574.1 guanylate cyclase [Rhodobacteraceae bacterium 4F10]
MSSQTIANTKNLSEWLVANGLEGASQGQLLEEYCNKLLAMGVPLLRLHVAQRAFHPEYGGIGFDWLRESGFSDEQYTYSETPVQQWLASPFYMMLQERIWEYRERIGIEGHQSTFPLLQGLQESGATDYVAAAVLFEKPDPSKGPDPNDTPEGMLISWTSDAADGFSDDDVALLKETLPVLGLALKSAANRQMASDLLKVYLGRDAGQRVLSGEIRRGSLQSLDAVIFYFDLSGFTVMTEQIPAPSIVEMLNDYFALAVKIVREHGGHVLKFMGDGMLAMFDHGELGDAAKSALDASVDLGAGMEVLSAGRAAKGLPHTGYTLALHAGEILYGNIGAETRLDFTVIGSAVNQTARIGGMHGALGQKVLISQAVQNAAVDTEYDLVPLGRYMLRGVTEPQMLYTLYLRGS